MVCSRSFLAALGVALAATTAQAQSTTPATTAPAAPAATAVPAPQPVSTASEGRYPKSSLSLSMGWGAPYGLGVDYSYMVMPNLDLNAGVGFGMGAKIGVGARYYFAPQRKLSPFVGTNLVRTGGIEDITIDIDNPGQQETVEARYKPSTQLFLRGGLRWQPTFRFGMFGVLGYGINLSGSPVEYKYGEPQYQYTRDIIELAAPGGVEISLGFAIGLGPQY